MAHIITRTTISRFEATATFATREEAEAFAALFPKSYRVKAGTYSPSPRYTGLPHFAMVHYALNPQHGNAVNEAGEQRAVRFMDKAEKMGHTIEHVR